MHKFVCALLVSLVLSGCVNSKTENDLAKNYTLYTEQWNKQRLNEAFELARKMGSTTLIVITGGDVIKSMGDIETPHDVHSVRKAFLSALVGQHIGDMPNQVNLESTLAELGIDDHPNPLNDLQKQAKVLDLIRSVSGINHAAVGEGSSEVDLMAGEKNRRLGVRPNRPGTVWAYNNWDYNALTTIFEKQTGVTIYEAFKTGIAEPLEMENFTKDSVYYLKNEKLSKHAKAGFRLSASDLAKFGQLYLNKGVWNGKQLIPVSWVKRTTRDYTKTGDQGIKSGHGYLWWVPCDRISRDIGISEGTFVASGYAGQRIVVIPFWNTIIVHQVSTDDYRGFCAMWAKSHGYKYRQAVAYSRNECRKLENSGNEFCCKCCYFSGEDFHRLLLKIIEARNVNRS